MELRKQSVLYNLTLGEHVISASITYEEKQYIIEFSMNEIMFHKTSKRKYTSLDKDIDLINKAISNFIKLHKAAIESSPQLTELFERYKEVKFVSKTVKFETEYSGVFYNIIMKENRQNLYEFFVTNMSNDDEITYKIKADSFTDLFEKLTLYARTVSYGTDIIKDSIDTIEKGEYAQRYYLD